MSLLSPLSLCLYRRISRSWGQLLHATKLEEWLFAHYAQKHPELREIRESLFQTGVAAGAFDPRQTISHQLIPYYHIFQSPLRFDGLYADGMLTMYRFYPSARFDKLRMTMRPPPMTSLSLGLAQFMADSVYNSINYSTEEEPVVKSRHQKAAPVPLPLDPYETKVVRGPWSAVEIVRGRYEVEDLSPSLAVFRLHNIYRSEGALHTAFLRRRGKGGARLEVKLSCKYPLNADTPRTHEFPNLDGIPQTRAVGSPVQIFSFASVTFRQGPHA